MGNLARARRAEAESARDRVRWSNVVEIQYWRLRRCDLMRVSGFLDFGSFSACNCTMLPVQATSLDLVDTEYSACSVSCCPNDRSLVATGLYQVVRDEDAPVLDESSPPTKRLGRCLLSRMDVKGKLYARLCCLLEVSPEERLLC